MIIGMVCGASLAFSIVAILMALGCHGRLEQLRKDMQAEVDAAVRVLNDEVLSQKTH